MGHVSPLVITFSSLLSSILVSRFADAATAVLSADFPAGLKVNGNDHNLCRTIVIPRSEPQFIVNVSVEYEPEPVSGIKPTIIFAYGCRELGHRYLASESSAGISSFPTTGYDVFANGSVCADNLFNVFVTPDGKLPPGLGFMVGPGTGLNFIAACAHFHAHDMTASGPVLPAMSQTSHVVVSFDMVSGVDAAGIKPAGLLTMSRYRTGSIPAGLTTLIPISYKIMEPVNITAVGILIHTHSLARTAELRVERGNHPPGTYDVVFRTDITGPTQYRLLDQPAPIHHNDTMMLVCEFVNPTDADVAIGYEFNEEMCEADLLYYGTDGRILDTELVSL